MANTMTRSQTITEPDPFEPDWWEDFYASLGEDEPFEHIEEPPLRGIGSRVRRRIRGGQKTRKLRRRTGSSPDAMGTQIRYAGSGRRGDRHGDVSPNRK